MKQITIHSDGSRGPGTAIVGEDGSLIPNISAATIWLEAGDLPRADLTIMVPNLNVTAGLNGIDFECPICNESQKHRCPS
jgi:hypothetical protein